MDQTSSPSSPPSADDAVDQPVDAGVDEAVSRGLQAKLPPGELLITWARAWVSRDWRLPQVFAARTLDFTVLTSDRLVLISTGFFTRRPRRRVYAMSLDRLFVEECDAKRGLRLRVHTWDHRPLLLEFKDTPQNNEWADELFACTAAPPSTPPDVLGGAGTTDGGSRP